MQQKNPEDRSKAVAYLMDNTFANEANVGDQVDRYISFPGQALAYKMGERKIQDVRRSLEQDGGFEIKRFHEGVLMCQGPLDDLEPCVREVISSSASMAVGSFSLFVMSALLSWGASQH